MQLGSDRHASIASLEGTLLPGFLRPVATL
jgi:hypothetical protein